MLRNLKHTITFILIMMVLVLIDQKVIKAETKVEPNPNTAVLLQERINRNHLIKKILSNKLILSVENEEGIHIPFYDIDFVIEPHIINMFTQNQYEYYQSDFNKYLFYSASKYLYFAYMSNVQIPININRDKLESMLKTTLKQYNMDAKNASIMLVDGQLAISKEQFGSAIVMDGVVNSLVNQFLAFTFMDIEYDVKISNIIPKIKEEDLCKIDTKLTSYETRFQSSPARINNLINGSSFVDDTIIMPGEVFSAFELMAPFTELNGYDSSSSFTSNDIVDSIGGGVCQITSTLYNAFINLDLEIVERHPHNFYVSYVDLGRDAAISSKYKDLKVKNTTDYPKYIRCYISNNKVVVDIYGNKNDVTEYSFEYEAKEILAIAPGKDYIEIDYSMNSDYTHIINESRYGYKIELYKVYYKNDVEVKRVLINNSEYKPLRRKIIKGVD